MNLPTQKTKIVATIGPASMAQETLEAMLVAGMSVARLNFSHGDFEQHGEVIRQVMAASPCDAILVPTAGGDTARLVAQARPPVWILAVGGRPSALQGLCFSAGVHPLELAAEPDSWNAHAKQVVHKLGLSCHKVMLIAGPSEYNPQANQRIEIIAL